MPENYETDAFEAVNENKINRVAFSEALGPTTLSEAKGRLDAR